MPQRAQTDILAKYAPLVIKVWRLWGQLSREAQCLPNGLRKSQDAIGQFGARPLLPYESAIF